MTFQDQIHFFRTFQVLEILGKNPGLSRKHGNPVYSKPKTKWSTGERHNNLPAETMRFSFRYATASRTVDILSSWEVASPLCGSTLLSCIKSSASALRRQRAASRETCLRFSEYLTIHSEHTNNTRGLLCSLHASTTDKYRAQFFTYVQQRKS